MNQQLLYYIISPIGSPVSLINDNGSIRTVSYLLNSSRHYHSYISLTNLNWQPFEQSCDRCKTGSFVYKTFTGEKPCLYVSVGTWRPGLEFRRIFRQM